jgi:peroxiredoxin
MTTKSMSKKHAAYARRQRRVKPNKTWLYVNLVVAVVLILAGIGMLFWLGQQSAAGAGDNSSPAQVGQTASDFHLSSLDGEPVALSDYRGQVVVVNLWATWCPPCKAEMPAINTFYKAYRDEGFVVLAVNSQEDAATVQTFIQANGFSFPVLLDQQAEVINRYQVRGLPTTFIIDRDGIIRYVHTGAITENQLERIIKPLL